MIENKKPYDLEDRTREFAKRVRRFVKGLRKSIASIEDAKQLIKASGSVGANYIEVCEALSKKDSILRIKICRKESKESRYWLRLIEADDEDQETERRYLEQEATELMNIFGSILRRKEKEL
jgi:four helix bundle protein